MWDACNMKTVMPSILKWTRCCYIATTAIIHHTNQQHLYKRIYIYIWLFCYCMPYVGATEGCLVIWWEIKCMLYRGSGTRQFFSCMFSHCETSMFDHLSFEIKVVNGESILYNFTRNCGAIMWRQHAASWYLGYGLTTKVHCQQTCLER